MVNKTRKMKEKIEHHHLLLRIETNQCPSVEDKEKMENMIHELVKDIDMKPLGTTEVFYVSKPKYNEGLTAVQVIQTSHIAFHFWKNPEKNILKCKRSHCLLQMDVYTCGKLSSKHIGTILNALAIFDPTHADVTLLNRKWSLNVEKHDRWDTEDKRSWSQWVKERY